MPTGDYHRPIAHRLLTAGFDVVSISSMAQSRFREAMFNSWDKNDPKDVGESGLQSPHSEAVGSQSRLVEPRFRYWSTAEGAELSVSAKNSLKAATAFEAYIAEGPPPM